MEKSNMKGRGGDEFPVIFLTFMETGVKANRMFGFG
jgi:hypothetical protein